MLYVPLAEKSLHFSSIAEAQKLSTELTCWPPVLSYTRDVIKTSPQAEPHLFQYNPPGKYKPCGMCPLSRCRAEHRGWHCGQDHRSSS